MKAQIKLRFRDPNGKPIVCTRSLQLTQLAASQRCKTLECALQVRDDKTGEPRTTSSRCADMDRLIPELMGIRKAILENVIFCHQEVCTKQVVCLMLLMLRM